MARLFVLNQLTHLNSALTQAEQSFHWLTRGQGSSQAINDDEKRLLRSAHHSLQQVRTVVSGVRDLIYHRQETQAPPG
jgi:hypothetical protein